MKRKKRKVKGQMKTNSLMDKGRKKSKYLKIKMVTTGQTIEDQKGFSLFIFSHEVFLGFE